MKLEGNGYSRVPDELLETLLGLSNAAAKVFLVLNGLANRKRDPVGMVDLQPKELANKLGSSPGSTRRVLKELAEAGLVSYEHTHGRHGSAIRVLHYQDHGDPHEDHGDPDRAPQDHGDPHQDHCDPHQDHGDPEAPLKELIPLELSVPSNDKSNDKSNVREDRRRREPIRISWDAEGAKMNIEDRGWYEKFKRRWLEQMDEQDYMTEVVKANNWLALEDGRRNKIRRLDRFFNNWLNRRIGERR